MTRTLSNILQANHATLGLQLRQFERLSGHENTDIKLSVEVVQAAKHKVHDLGLDMHDTTPQELYQVLLQRISDDDRRLERALQTRAATYVSAEANVMDGLVHAITEVVKPTTVLAMKSAAAKRLLKKNPLKRLPKLLGYRSYDSMLRQESPALLISVAQHTESAIWRKAWFDSYKLLKPTDFEDHQLQVLHPAGSKWQAIAADVVQQHAHTVLSQPEMGAVIMLPMPVVRPAGMTVASTALALHEINTVTAATSYLRASQVQADFGQRIKAVATGQVYLQTPHMPQALPWQLVQRYFKTNKQQVDEDIFGPYVQAKHFDWLDVEEQLTRLCPSMAFWNSTSYLTFVQQGQAVSLNVVDMAINCCNAVSYQVRTMYHAQQALWSELCLRYIDHASIETAVAGLLQPHLALATADN